jgi:hypothetical protein
MPASKSWMSCSPEELLSRRWKLVLLPVMVGLVFVSLLAFETGGSSPFLYIGF